MQPNENRPHYQLQPEALFLYRRRVQHDTNGSTERLGGKGGGELGADDAGVSCRDKLDGCSCRRSPGRVLITVWSSDLAPDHADLGAADLLLAPVDESNLLAEIEAIMNVSIQTDWEYSSHVDVLGGVGVINTLNLDQAGSRAGGVTRALVAQVTSPKPISSVQNSYRSLCSCRGFAEYRYRKSQECALVWASTSSSYRMRDRLAGRRVYSLDVYYRQS